MQKTTQQPPVFCRFTEMRPLVSLVEHPRNPNTHPQTQLELLADVIRGNGWRQPITVSDLSGYIIKGHGRYQAAKLAGFTDVPVEVQHYENEAAELADMLADNRIAELSEMDVNALNETLQALQIEDPAALELSGYTEEDWASIKAELEQLNEEKQTATDQDEVPENEEEKPTFSLPGDIWFLGRHKLICGDSTQEDCFSALMGEERAMLVFTDPPYNVNYAEKNTFLNEISRGNRIQTDIIGDNEKSDEEVGEKLWKPAFFNLRKFSADDASIYVTMPQGGAHMMMMMMMMMSATWQVKHELVWVKNNHVLGRADYNYQHEPIAYGWAEKHHFYGAGRFKTSLWSIPKPLKSELHPTMKPVALVEEVLLNSSKRGDIVLDAFGGSGTTIIACEKLSRVARLVELSGHYCDTIAKRFHQAFPAEPCYLMREGERIEYPFE